MRLVNLCLCVVLLLGASRHGAGAEGPSSSWERVSKEVDQSILQGIDAEKQGNSAAAEKAYLHALQRCREANAGKHQLPSLHRLAVLKAKQNKFDESEQYFRQALPYGQTNISLISDFAQLQFDRQRYRESEILLKHCLLIDMENKRVLHKLGYAVALQPDRQTEGLRYLKLALGDVQALRELAKIDRSLGLEEQATFAEQRAVILEGQQKDSAAANAPKDAAVQKELHEQIRRELIREYSIQLAAEFEKAGLDYLVAKDADEQRKINGSTAGAQQEVAANADAWNFPPVNHGVESTLKPLPATDFGPVPNIRQPTASQPVAAKNPEQKLRISNEKGTVPLPPVDSRQAAAGRVRRWDEAAPVQYPQYAQIGSRSAAPPQPATPAPVPVPVKPQPSLMPAQEKLTRVAPTDPSHLPSNTVAPRPTAIDLVQPFNLAALETPQRKESVPTTAPTPENVDARPFRPTPAGTPLPEGFGQNALRAPESAADRGTASGSRNSFAPTPEAVAFGNITSPDRSSVAREQREPELTATTVKAWKEIDVEPYIYIEKQRTVEPPAPKEPPKETVAQADPWGTPTPAMEKASEPRTNKLREKETESKSVAKIDTIVAPPFERKPEPKTENKAKPGDDFVAKIMPGLTASEKPAEKVEASQTDLAVDARSSHPQTVTKPEIAQQPVVEKKPERSVEDIPATKPETETKKIVRSVPDSVAPSTNPEPVRQPEPKEVARSVPAPVAIPTNSEPVHRPEPKEIVRYVPVPVPMPNNPSEPENDETKNRPPVPEIGERNVVDRKLESLAMSQPEKREPPKTSFRTPTRESSAKQEFTSRPDTEPVQHPVVAAKPPVQRNDDKEVLRKIASSVPSVTETKNPNTSTVSETSGFAKTPSVVRIINVNVPNPVDETPGFARSGQYSSK